MHAILQALILMMSDLGCRSRADRSFCSEMRRHGKIQGNRHRRAVGPRRTACPLRSAVFGRTITQIVYRTVLRRCFMGLSSEVFPNLIVPACRRHATSRDVAAANAQVHWTFRVCRRSQSSFKSSISLHSTAMYSMKHRRNRSSDSCSSIPRP